MSPSNIIDQNNFRIRKEFSPQKWLDIAKTGIDRMRTRYIDRENKVKMINSEDIIKNDRDNENEHEYGKGIVKFNLPTI